MNTIEQLKPLTKRNEDEFITRPDDVSLYGFDTDCEHYAQVGLRWRIDLDLRSWGLKDITAYTIQAQVEIYDEDDNLVEQADTLDHDNWAVIDEGIDFNKIVMPTSVEVRYKEKTITVNWD